jgi:predicted RNA-binding Zn-ribbon protein involved in translation (DUF1610 family)
MPLQRIPFRAAQRAYDSMEHPYYYQDEVEVEPLPKCAACGKQAATTKFHDGADACPECLEIEIREAQESDLMHDYYLKDI